MRLYTSYFAKCKYDDKCVAICQKPPEWYTGRRALHLAPSWNIITAYKQGKITSQDFRSAYLTYLDRIGIDHVLLGLHDGDVLLCWEAKGKFCHRHILAEWLEQYGHTVTELD